MTQQEALSALFNNAARRPVDVNLGQVPLTPTIGRMGNYNVVVRDTPRDNSALELSRALSQLPQLLGQARNISAASGARQAEEITLEELETKVKNGDADAKGTMTWLGADKAYQELAYKRLADANITPTLTNISSEIDRMSHAELLKFNSPDDIKDHVQGRLVGSLDPGIMETIKGKPWMEIRHNRYMEAIVPEYVEKVNASIEGRKHEFKIKEAIAALETNFLAQAGINLEDIPTEQIDSVLAVSQEAKFDPSQMWLDNFQYALDFARSQGEASGLDRFQIEDTLIPALTAKYNMLVEDEHHSEADLLLEAMESGSLKINGRPINKSSAGMRLIQNAEARLERSLEADQAGMDIEKINGIKSDTLRFLSGEKVKPGYDPDSMIPLLQQQENDLYNDPANPMSNKEIIELSGFFARTRDGVRGRGEIHSETSDEKREELGEKFRKTYKSVNPEEIAVSVERDALEKAFLDAGGDPEFWDNQLTTTILDPEGYKPPKVVFQNPASRELSDAASQASRSTVATFIDRPIEELFLGDVASEDIEKQSQLRTQITDKADEFFIKEVAARLLGLQESFKAQNPPLSPEEAQKRETDSVDEEISERHYKRGLSGGEALINANGEITSKIRPNQGSYTPYGGSGSSGEVVTFYPLNTANETIKNKYGVELLKENPLLKRLELMGGLEKEASNPARLRAVGKTLDQIYGTDVYDSELKRELELVRYSGISFGALLDGGRADGEYTTKTGMFGPFAPKADQRQVPWTIDYNKFDNFSTAAATKERIFNLGAITRYKQQGKDDDFRRIYSALLKNSGISLEAFIQNQVKLAESVYGNLEE
jgi:hypothetical protein